jgi:hypothetical protein
MVDFDNMVATLMKNKRGVTQTVGSIMMILVTVSAMVLVISFGQDFINRRSDQMSERLYIEKIFFNGTTIQVYVRNIGFVDVTLITSIVNGKTYDLTEGKVPVTDEGQFVNIENYEVDPQGIYSISFLTSRFNELGHTQVQYLP